MFVLHLDHKQRILLSYVQNQLSSMQQTLYSTELKIELVFLKEIAWQLSLQLQNC